MALLIKITAATNFELIYQWKQIEYKFSSEQERFEAIANGTFNVGKVVPSDAQYTFEGNNVCKIFVPENFFLGKERIFVATPRLTSRGVPATFGIITNETRDGNPVIDPYPSWSWQLQPEKCNYHRIVSVFRTWVSRSKKNLQNLYRYNSSL